jgi:protein-disulfide isomerase
MIWLAGGGLLVLACSAAFIGALIFNGRNLLEVHRGETELPADPPQRSITLGPTMGNPHAPIHIIEYVDFQCPYCLEFWRETEPQLIEAYVNTGEVYFEYRALPILGEESNLAAEAAFCAGDQEMFWEYHDTLFSNWAGENAGGFAREKLLRYAKGIKLDLARFESCLDGGEHRRTVARDRALAQADGVQSTPVFIINGRKLEGAQPFVAFERLIQQILQGDFDTVTG